MAPPRILVTGASGFIGLRVLAPLRKLGFEVHAASRLSAGPAGAPPGIFWHAADLLKPGEARFLMEKVRPSHLLHFAWYAEHGLFWNSPLNLDWLSATLSLLKAFAETGGERFIGAGSCAEYAWDSPERHPEEYPLRPATLYGAAKASAYMTGEAFARAANLSFAWGRIFHLFGPGESPDRIVPALIRAHLSGEPLKCSQGTQLRDFLPASAVAEAFASLCASGVAGAVNIGSGQSITLRQLSDKISVLTASNRKAEIRFGAFHDAGPERLLPATDRLEREVGWRAPESLEPGLSAAIEWWKARA